MLRYNVPTQNLQRNLQFPAHLLHVAKSILSSPNLSNQPSTLMLSLTMIMPTPNEDGHHRKAISTFYAAIRQSSDPELSASVLNFLSYTRPKMIDGIEVGGFADWQWLPITFRTAFVALPRQNRQHSF